MGWGGGEESRGRGGCGRRGMEVGVDGGLGECGRIYGEVGVGDRWGGGRGGCGQVWWGRR